MSRWRDRLRWGGPIAFGVAFLVLMAARPARAAHSHGGGGSHSSGHSSVHSGSGHSSFRSGFHGGGFRGGFHGGFRGGFHGGVRIFPGWGWGWYYPWWWDGYYYPGYPYAYPYRYAESGAGSEWTAVKTDVEPDEAALYLDGRLIGTADDFDGYPDRLYLGPGHYHLEFRLDGYEPYTTDIDAAPGRSFRLDQRLRKIKGASHYGTYEPARPEGGVMRFWVKNGSTDVPQSPDDMRPSRRAYVRDYPPNPGPDEAPGDVDEPGYSEDRNADAQEQASEAMLTFEVEPEEAAVDIDGRFAGGARDLNSMDEGFVVEPGRHHITVTCPGYRESTIDVTAGLHRRAKVRLSLSR